MLAMAFAEGSANDWLPLLMVDGHGFSPTSGSLIYAGFTLGMTVGRFTGGWFIDRYSRVAVVRASALMGALGIGLIIFVDSAWVAGVSVVLWGLGASLGFPLTISAASDTGPDAPTRVSVVATTGYLAFLVGPPLLGYLASGGVHSIFTKLRQCGSNQLFFRLFTLDCHGRIIHRTVHS